MSSRGCPLPSNFFCLENWHYPLPLPFPGCDLPAFLGVFPWHYHFPPGSAFLFFRDIFLSTDFKALLRHLYSLYGTSYHLGISSPSTGRFQAFYVDSPLGRWISKETSAPSLSDGEVGSSRGQWPSRRASVMCLEC